MADFDASQGSKKLADKLARLNAGLLQREIVKTTLLGQEAIADKITSDVRPHSGKHRKRNPQPIVTDLVDTGAYRQSFLPTFPDAFEGRVSTNIEYAAPLEYGTEHMAGFFVCRDTARKMSAVFRDNLQKAINEAVNK